MSQRLADASVAARAKQALARHRTLRRFDFSLSAVRGRLVLRGDVDTREQYREAERVAAALDAVRAVANEVTVDGRPVTSADPSSAGTAYHTVRRGDTLSEIARRYGVSVQQLRRLNDQTSSLQPGERIRVR
ncbi:LysM peptidoglycan-binding domain-containing protein [Salinibacter ruber]|uniref:LysM peptidoglycan-binding domain-containing protein n=1 Tax=Salinibacter ruber TaxID=146919 RepID=UPI0021675DA4|nr:LysM repeat protein [Salinibacter ruber]